MTRGYENGSRVNGNAETRTISELILSLKSAFQSVDFDTVEAVLIQKEKKLKGQIEGLLKEKKLLEERSHLDRLDKIKAENELKVYKRKFEELESHMQRLERDVAFLKNGEPLANDTVCGGNAKSDVDLKANKGPLSNLSDNGIGIMEEKSISQTGKVESINVGERSEQILKPGVGVNEGTNYDYAVNKDGDVKGRRMQASKDIEIVVRDNDSGPCEILGNNGLKDQATVEIGTAALKRKRVSNVNIEGNTDENDQDVVDNCLTGSFKMTIHQELTHRPRSSSQMHNCSMTTMSSQSNISGKGFTQSALDQAVTQSALDQAALRQCERNMETQCKSHNERKFVFDSSSSSSSESEDDVDLSFDFSTLTKTMAIKRQS